MKKKKQDELEEKLSKLEEDLGLMYEGSKIKYLTGGKNYLTKKDIPEEIKPFISFGSGIFLNWKKASQLKLGLLLEKTDWLKKQNV